MSERRPVLVIGAAAALALGGLAAEWAHLGGRLDFPGLVELATGWAIGGCGLLAWSRAPDSRVGPLLMITALAWFVGTVRDADTDVGRIALALLYLYAGPLAHAVFTWPSGHVTRSLDRVLVIAGYVVALFPPLWQRDVGLLAIGALLMAGVLVQHATLPRRVRVVRRPALVAGLVLAFALLGKRAISQWALAQGVAVGRDPDTIWSIAITIACATLAGGLIALARHRAVVTDMVVQLGDDRSSLAEIAARSDHDPDVASALARAELILERNARLRAEVASQVHALEASRRRLLEVGDEERRRLEWRLRTGPAQRLADLAATLEVVLAAGGQSVRPDGLARLRRAGEQVGRARAELDEIARGLDPVVLAHGLDLALRELARRSPVPVEVQVSASLDPAPSVQTTLFYVASEALANVIRHAHASRAWLRLAATDGDVSLDVEDDGVGGAEPPRGSGLRGLRDRLEACGGSLWVGDREQGGTRLAVRIPMGGQGEDA